LPGDALDFSRSHFANAAQFAVTVGIFLAGLNDLSAFHDCAF
jgi:hypothetical protein